MQIRIIVPWPVVSINRPLKTICNVFRQLPCLLGQHHEELDRSEGKLALRCMRCGWKSQGWNLDYRRPVSS